jgi:hypothetical protein
MFKMQESLVSVAKLYFGLYGIRGFFSYCRHKITKMLAVSALQNLTLSAEVPAVPALPCKLYWKLTF